MKRYWEIQLALFNDGHIEMRITNDDHCLSFMGVDVRLKCTADFSSEHQERLDAFLTYAKKFGWIDVVRKHADGWISNAFRAGLEDQTSLFRLEEGKRVVADSEKGIWSESLRLIAPMMSKEILDHHIALFEIVLVACYNAGVRNRCTIRDLATAS